MRRSLAITCVLLVSALGAELVDRIAVAVGNRAIKESQINRGLRLTAFLNGTPLDTSAAAKKKAADHLIDQTIIRGEMAKGSYPAPSETEIAQTLAAIKKARFRSDADYSKALESYGITETELRAYIGWQLQVLRFVDLRFEAPVRSQAASNTNQRVLGERANEAFFAWLDQSRKRIRIDYHDEVLH